MEQPLYEENFSGRRLRYAFQYPGTELYMKPYVKKAQGGDCDIRVSQERIERYKLICKESADVRYIEYKALVGLTSLALLSSGCCIIHAVAVLLDGLCWLISAPPGTGKTTQYKNLKKLYGEKLEMICGDMPLLEKTAEGKIMVRPSPWNGKERIRGTKSAPLGGILLLKQGPENMIRELEAEESVIPVFLQLVGRPDTEEQALQIAAIVDLVLQKYPVWEMINKGDLDSSRLAADTFRGYVREKL